MVGKSDCPVFFVFLTAKGAKSAKIVAKFF